MDSSSFELVLGEVDALASEDEVSDDAYNSAMAFQISDLLQWTQTYLAKYTVPDRDCEGAGGAGTNGGTGEPSSLPSYLVLKTDAIQAHGSATFDAAKQDVQRLLQEAVATSATAAAHDTATGRCQRAQAQAPEPSDARSEVATTIATVGSADTISFAAAAKKGFQSSSFDLSENLSSGDARGLAVAELEGLMKDGTRTFDEARVELVRRQMIRHGINPETCTTTAATAVQHTPHLSWVDTATKTPAPAAGHTCRHCGALLKGVARGIGRKLGTVPKGYCNATCFGEAALASEDKAPLECPPDAPDAPAPWCKTWDATKDMVVYTNTVTGKTVHHIQKVKAAIALASAEPAPDDWVKLHTASRGVVYHNVLTKVVVSSAAKARRQSSLDASDEPPAPWEKVWDHEQDMVYVLTLLAALLVAVLLLLLLLFARLGGWVATVCARTCVHLCVCVCVCAYECVKVRMCTHMSVACDREPLLACRVYTHPVWSKASPAWTHARSLQEIDDELTARSVVPDPATLPWVKEYRRDSNVVVYR